MIGRKVLPCGHRRVRLPDEAGDYPRTCDVCKKRYVAQVVGSVYWTRRMGRPEFVVHWDTGDDESPAPDKVDAGHASARVDDDGGEQ